ncbi:MAG: zinc ribbon domain-containing protein [Candidatus Dormibacteria bacterium]
MTAGEGAPETPAHRGRRLLVLQQLDDRIGGLETEVSETEAVLAGDPELARLREAAGAAEAQRRAAEEKSRGVEKELTGVRQRARSLERRLYDGSVHNPQDLLGMQHDLAAIKPRLDELEGRLLEWMEATEDADGQVESARVAVAARESERASLEAPRRERLEAARGELEAARVERATAAAATEPGDLRTYQRVAAHRRPAVVHLEGDSCGGCHLPLGVREANHARAGSELVQCSNCDRVVVR